MFTLHRVRPSHPRQSAFNPNDVIEITPEFLAQTIQRVRAFGYEIVSLDELFQRVCSGESPKRFACFTLDDGYTDSYEYAMPVFETHRCPYAIYLTTGFIDRIANPWWLVLEKIVDEHDHVEITIDQTKKVYNARSVGEKYDTFAAIYWLIRQLTADDIYEVSNKLAATYEVNWKDLCTQEFMNWDMVRATTQSGLCTLGAHTIMHHPVSRMTKTALLTDIEGCRRRICEMTGADPRHFAYPFGDPTSVGQRDFRLLGELGFATSCTTNNGVIMSHHKNELHALPRVPLHGGYQSTDYVDFVISGLPFALKSWKERHNRNVEHAPGARAN